MNEFTATIQNLITVNKNRTVNYKLAHHWLQNCNAAFAEFISENIRRSENNIEELKKVLKDMGEKVNNHTTTTGVIYTVWNDLLYAQTEPPADIKQFCLQTEQSTMQVYEKALSEAHNQPKPVADMLSTQAYAIKQAHKQLLVQF